MLTGLLIVTLVSCTGGDDQPEPSLSSVGAPGEAQPDGVVRVIVGRNSVSPLSHATALDPQTDWWNDSFEVFRCCLLRTLLSHLGAPTAEGGAILHPDLAAGLPGVSADGLTWTFRLKTGIAYAPPLQRTDVVARDVIRALEREATIGSYAFFYEVIEGFAAVSGGEAASISGLEAPDDATLVVHLTRPAGDLGDLFSMPATAPIPPLPDDPSARLGVAEGVRRYGRSLVATGPYMIEGSEELDLSVPPRDREPIAGYEPGSSLTLVRNPSWSAETDDLRPAYTGRIELTLGTPIGEAVRAIEAGEADLYLYDAPAPQIPVDVVQRYLDHPELGVAVEIETRDVIRYITMNLAVPPLDDIHVRRAINLAIDRERLRELRGGPLVGDVAGHVALDSLENGYLSRYAPYPNSLPDARDEMARSRYDRDRDGRCDDASCRGLLLLSATGIFPELAAMAESVRADLHTIGIDLRIETIGYEDQYERLADPSAQVPMGIGLSWGKDFLNASSFVDTLFSRKTIGSYNLSLVGATPDQLAGWGYATRSVPSVDRDIERCQELVGDLQVRCWAELDQLLMTDVVPWVPYFIENRVQLLSSSVVSYAFDQFAAQPALDRIAVAADPN
jgi:peptide/nickel transport system substrate-binding protein